MILLTNYEVVGWQHAIRGMRNPFNSWTKSDSDYCWHMSCADCAENECDGFPDDMQHEYCIGTCDLALMKGLSKAGTDHAKYMRMIAVYVDITAPLYWWKEFDTYKVGTVANSTSTMHKIHSKEFTLDDFSTDKLIKSECPIFSEMDIYRDSFMALDVIIDCLNYYRKKYVETKDKKYWWQMIQLLPSSYNQTRTVMLNYAVLQKIYHARKNHKLDEWVMFCGWIESLPHSQLITGKEN